MFKLWCERGISVSRDLLTPMTQQENVRIRDMWLKKLTLCDQCSHSPCSFTRYSKIVSCPSTGGKLRLPFPLKNPSIYEKKYRTINIKPQLCPSV